MAEPFSTQSLLFGIEGIDLKRAVDLIKPTRLARMTNVTRNEEGALQGRQGINPITTAAAGTDMHSIIRVSGYNVGGAVTTHHYVICIDNQVFWGTDAGIADVLAAPLSNRTGVPATFVNVLMEASSQTTAVWTLIADDNPGVMYKVRETDGLLKLFSLPPPLPAGTVATYIAGTAHTTTIDNCDVAGWTNNAGTGGAPANAADAVIKKEGAASLKLTTNAGGAPALYYNFWNKANALNLNLLSGPVVATDDDIIHLWIMTDRPDLITEFRVYFVITAAFNVNTVPGTSATLNTDAYYKSFRPSDFTPVVEVTASTIPTAGTAVSTGSTVGSLPTIFDARAAVAPIVQQLEDARKSSVQLGPGRGAWQELGVIGFPLRRGDFSRIGSDTARTWGTVTGLVLAAQVNTNAVANIWLDDIFLTGGAGPDTSPLGATGYDYRFTHVDIDTGEESNPSPVSITLGVTNTLDSLRRAITVQGVAMTALFPVANYPNVRQAFYRRGGTLPDNWRLVGGSSTDGGTFSDTLSDLAISSAKTLDIDNDPMPFISSEAGISSNLPCPSIWGPVNGINFACGAANMRGTLFWSKVDKGTVFPVSFTFEVCTPSEELMNGFVVAGQSYILSRERLYANFSSVSNAAVMNVNPTQCRKGLAARYAFVVYLASVFFVSKDGVYVSQGPGGPEKNIGDDRINTLFSGQHKYDYQPIDWSFPNAIRMEVHESEIWLKFQGVGTELEPADIQVWIYNTLYDFWRHHVYAVQPSVFYSEEGEDASHSSRLLVGGAQNRTLGYIPSLEVDQYTKDFSTQMSDVHIRTGALDQGLPRVTKLYGDAFIDVDDKGNSGVVITPYINNESQALTPTTLVPVGAGRERFYIPIDEILARNISLDISWTPVDGSNITPPIIYQGGISYTPQPDTTETRVTNWDTQGRLADKWVKGVLFEVDTGGLAKPVDILADGVVQTSITVQATGRQVLQFSFQQFRGRILRLAPTNTTQWIVYDFRWIFDEEPLSLLRWESQEVDHGFHGQQVPLFGHISIRSSANVSLLLTAYRQDGTSVAKTYTLANTAGAKTKLFVPFEATRGVLFKYEFTSEAPFWLYREESTVRIQPWGAPEPLEVSPFGNDDLDQPMRNMMDAGLSAARGGAGHR